MQRLMRHVPNILTVARLLALPFVVWTYALYAPGAAWTTAWIVLFAALSDVADGLIARRYHVQSEFGRWVDPIVDRLFFFTLVAMLWYFGTLPWWAVLPLLRPRRHHPGADRPDAALHRARARRSAAGARPATSSSSAPSSGSSSTCASIGWSFFAVGATLYVASGLLYGYRAIVWVRKARGGGGAAA